MHRKRRWLAWLVTPALLVTMQHPSAAASRPSLAEDLARYAATRSDTFSVGVFDEKHHWVYWFRPSTAYDNASIVKVNVLETLLWQAQRAHRWLTPWEEQQSTRMIRYSDNDATTALWNHVGRAAAVAAYDRALGLSATTFDPGGAWGLTRSVVRDQIVLLRAVGVGAGPLSARARSYVRYQMSQVASAQRWGVAAGAPSGATVEIKNGWLPREPGGWRINSIGHVRDAQTNYEIAFLSTNNPSMAYGVATAEGVARIVRAHLLGSY